MAMRRGVSCHQGYGQPLPTMNYHRTHSEHVTKVAASPYYHAGGGAVHQHHMAVHKESFKEVDEDCHDSRLGHNISGHAVQQQAHRHHGYNGNNHGGRHNGGGSHRHHESYEETCEEEEMMTYSAAAGRHHGPGGRRYEYDTYEETSYEEEDEEVVVGGGGYAQLRRGHRFA